MDSENIDTKPGHSLSKSAGSPADSVESNDSDREERLRSLRALSARVQTEDTTEQKRLAKSSVPRAPDALSQRRRLGIPVVVGVSALVIVAVAVVTVMRGGIVATSSRPPTGKSAPISFYPTLDGGLECPHDASWSPNGAEIAIIGYKGTCLGSATGTANPYEVNLLQSSTPALLNIYDTKKGIKLSTLHPDELILAHVSLPASVTTLLGNQQLNSGPLLTFNYTHVLWSADGQRLAITFNGYIPTAAPTTFAAPPQWPGYQVDGVVVVNLAGGAPMVLMRRFDPAHPLYTEWDLQSGDALNTAEALAPMSAFSTIQPAAQYRWGSSGGILPIGQLDSQSMFSAVAGSVNGGAIFSAYETGYALLQSSASPNAPSTGWTAYASDIAAWSPNGRYLIERGTLETLIVPSISSPAPSGWQGAPVASHIPPGLQQALMKFSRASADVSGADFIATEYPLMYAAPLAWNAQASRIALFSPSLKRVFVLDTQSGRQIASLTPVANPNATQSYTGAEANMLRWSPDGSRLLLYDPAIGAATIWDVPAN